MQITKELLQLKSSIQKQNDYALFTGNCYQVFFSFFQRVFANIR